MVNRNQCTILWHIDDLRISHVNSNVVTDMINIIDAEFGQESPIAVKRGKVKDYLGMTLDFSKEVKVMIKIIDYLDNML